MLCTLLFILLGTVRPKEISLGVLVTWQGNIWKHSESILGILPALREINDNPGILPNDTLTFAWADSQCDPRSAADAAAGLLEMKVDAIIGAPCSDSCLSIGLFTNYYNVPLISYFALHPDLSNKYTYPYFARVVDSTKIYDKTLIKFLKILDFKHAAMVYPMDSSFSLGWASTLRISLHNAGFHIDADIPYKSFGNLELRLLWRTGARVVLWLNYSCYRIRKLLHFASEKKILEGWTWVMEVVSKTCWQQAEAYADRIKSLYTFNGIFSIFSSYKLSEHAKDVLDAAKPDIESLILPFSGTSTKVPARGLNPHGLNYSMDQIAMSNDGSALVYDAIILYALAAHAVQSQGGSINDAQAIHKAMVNTRFQGFTGNVVLDETGTRVGSASIIEVTVNSQGNGLISREVFFYQGDKDISKLLVPAESLVFAGGIQEKPPDHVTVCEAGYYSPSSSKEECFRCEAGKFAKEQDFDRRACDLCSAGRFQRNMGQSACSDCWEGSFQSLNGSAECNRCDKGTYQEEEGASTCNTCPEMQTTLGAGSNTENDCVCAEGTYMDCTTQRCMTCTEGLHCPVAGLKLGSCSQNCVEDGIDKHFTPMLEIGYMSEAGSPLSILTCVSNNTCPTTRCLPGLEIASDACFGNAQGARCAKCADGWHMSSEYVCESCPAGQAKILKIAGIATIQFLAVLLQYGQAKINTGSLLPNVNVLLGPILPFVQKVIAFKNLNVEWPEFLQLPVSLSFLTSFSDFWDFFDISDSCVLPPHPAWILLRNACLPFVPLINFTIIAAFSSMCRIRVRWNKFISIYLELLSTFFVSIALMGVTMFNREGMPNGDYYLKSIPHLKFGAEEWSQAAPIGIVTCVLYCGAFIAYVVHAIMVAPNRAASDPTFVSRHEFMLDKMRCECWWWIATELFFAAAIAFVQTLSDDIFVHIYFLLVCAVFLLLGVFRFKPYVTALLNRTELMLKFSLVCQLLCMTVMIDTEHVPLDQYRQITGKIWLSSICIGIGFASVTAVYKAKIVFISERRGYAESVIFAYKLRDLIHLISMMPEKQFFATLLHLNSVERNQLNTARNVFIGRFLQEQPGHHLWQQRVMEGTPFKVWSSTETSSKVLAAMANGGASEAFSKNEQLRRNVQRLGSSIVQSVGSITTTGICELAAHNILSNVTENMGVTKHDLALSEDEFIQKFQLSSGLSVEDMREIFSLFDIDETRTLSIQEIVSALKAMTQEDMDVNDPVPQDENMEVELSEELETEAEPFHLGTLEQSETEAKPSQAVDESTEVQSQRCGIRMSL